MTQRLGKINATHVIVETAAQDKPATTVTL